MATLATNARTGSHLPAAIQPAKSPCSHCTYEWALFHVAAHAMPSCNGWAVPCRTSPRAAVPLPMLSIRPLMFKQCPQKWGLSNCKANLDLWDTIGACPHFNCFVVYLLRCPTRAAARCAPSPVAVYCKWRPHLQKPPSSKGS